jgi:hypothetical protein
MVPLQTAKVEVAEDIAEQDKPSKKRVSEFQVVGHFDVAAALCRQLAR